MIDLRLALFAILVITLIVALCDTMVMRTIGAWRLRLIGRTIDCDTAIGRYKDGLGFLIRNRSSLPGKWWFIFKKDVDSQAELSWCVRQAGFLVTFNQKNSLSTIEDYADVASEIVDSFED